jgi:hypothetical protein
MLRLEPRSGQEKGFEVLEASKSLYYCFYLSSEGRKWLAINVEKVGHVKRRAPLSIAL